MLAGSHNYMLPMSFVPSEPFEVFEPDEPFEPLSLLIILGC